MIYVLCFSHKLSISYKPLCSESGMFSDPPFVFGTTKVVREGGDGGEVCVIGYLGRNLSHHI